MPSSKYVREDEMNKEEELRTVLGTQCSVNITVLTIKARVAGTRSLETLSQPPDNFAP